MILYRKVEMAKCLVGLIVLLVVPVLTGGCGPVEPELSESAEDEALALEPVDAEPDKAEPVGVELVEPESNDVEPDKIEPNEPDPNDSESRMLVSFHDKCVDIFKNFVNDKGMVDYKGLRRKRYELRVLLDEFARLNPAEYESWPQEDKIAFWINAYNLQKLRVVADNYPIKPSSRILAVYWGPFNVRHIESKISKRKFLVMDEQFTFAEIQRRIFREQFNDPRIFLTLTSASLSSPPLRNKPYRGRNLSDQLDIQTRRFLSSPLAFKIDREKQRVYLSSVFELSSHGKDFAGKFATDKKFKDQQPTTRAVLNFITNYISKRDVSFLEVGNYSVKYMKHDWTINDGS